MTNASRPLFLGNFPTTRLRRNRQHAWSRGLVAEHHIKTEDLIWPLFIREDDLIAEIPSMPDVQRYTLKELPKALEQAVKLNIGTVALFPAYDNKRKDENASIAFLEDSLIPQAVRLIKKDFPNLGVITDAAFDAYTSHGQDGLIIDGEIHNDITLEALARHALVHAKAGADMIAPSDMMDGRVKVIREALDQHGFQNVGILSYAAKYASSFYGPFRDALNSKGCLGKADKKTYQMDPANVNEALREVALDLQEGADMVMVKPGLPYLDVILQVKHTFRVPTIVYQVSGEYSMMKVAATAGYLDYDKILMESLVGFKRAGADGIITYAALEAATLIRNGFYG